jgi:hypothetical protein
MLLYHGPADMLYLAVISLAGCSSAEPASVSYSDINVQKQLLNFSVYTIK